LYSSGSLAIPVGGDREAESRTVAVRHPEEGDKGAIPLEDLISAMRQEFAEQKPEASLSR